MSSLNAAQSLYAELNQLLLSNKALANLKAHFAPPVPQRFTHLGTYTAEKRPSRRRAEQRRLARFVEFALEPLVKPALYEIKRATHDAGLIFRDKASWWEGKAALKQAKTDQRVKKLSDMLAETKRLEDLAEHARTATERTAAKQLTAAEARAARPVILEMFDEFDKAVAAKRRYEAVAAAKPKRSRIKKTSAE